MPDQNRYPGDGGDNSSLFSAICVESALVVFISAVVTAARLLAKKPLSNYNIEDYFSLAAWICVNGFAATLLVAATKGFGKHIGNVDSAEDQTLAKMSWAMEQVYHISMWVTKAGLLFQLRPTFDVPKKSIVYIACQVLVWGNFAFYLSCWIVLLAECQPMAKIWDSSIQDGHCINRAKFFVAMSSINIASDVVMFILPAWTAWYLRVRFTKIYGVAALLAIAVLAVVCSIGRLVAVVAAWHSTDNTYTMARVTMWSLAEVTCILICTCLPLMPQFYRVVAGEKVTYPNSHDSFPPSKVVPIERPTSFTERCRDCLNGLLCQLHGGERAVTNSVGNFRRSATKKVRIPSSVTNNNDTLYRQETTASSGDRSSFDGRPLSQNPLASNGIIVRREFQVRTGVEGHSLGIETRNSVRDAPFDGSRVAL